MESEKYNLVSFDSDINMSMGKKQQCSILSKSEVQINLEAYISDCRKEEIKAKKNRTVSTKQELRQDKELVLSWICKYLTDNSIRIQGCDTFERFATFVDDMVGEFAGYSILEDAFNDPLVSDIYCIDWNTIFVERDGVNVPYERKFKNPEHYKRIVKRFVENGGKQLNDGDAKVADFELFGDRGCATSSSVSPRAYSLTLRKHPEDHVVLDQMLESHLMNEEMNRIFKLIIDGELNLIYAGITGSGKTTTLRALIDAYVAANGRRMLTCEDTQELFPKNEHTLELVSCVSEDKASSVPLDKLVVTALRLKPKYIVVGEVRGPEAQAAVEAMETGHSTLFSMHGGTSINIVNRLVTKYLQAMPSLGIDVVERIIGSAVDYIAIQDNIMGTGRRITSIVEVDYDFSSRRIKLTPIFEYDFEIEDFVMVNRLSKDKITKMMRRGVPLEIVKDLIKSDDPDIEKKTVAEINQKYQREKAVREENYKKRKALREQEKSANVSIDSDYENARKKMLSNTFNCLNQSDGGIGGLL